MGKAVVVMYIQKGALTESEIDDLKNQFEAASIQLIPVVYNSEPDLACPHCDPIVRL